MLSLKEAMYLLPGRKVRITFEGTIQAQDNEPILITTDGARWRLRAFPESARVTPVPKPGPHVIHALPPEGSNIMPCCGKTPFIVPRTDRIALDDHVTCPGPQPIESPSGWVGA